VREAFVRFIPNEVDRINQLIEGLINYARPVKCEKEQVNLAAIIKECLYFTHIASKLGNICFSTDLDDTAVICANRDRIKQSMINIIMNGIESMEKKLQSSPAKSLLMSIRVHKDMESAWVCIKDEGVGMSEFDIKQCTEPFYTTKKAGTGLGLALVKQFVEENDGVLDIHSKVGCYTEIMLQFRRCDANEKKDTNN
jgi:polar amino acid transport system substrate-binding protein